jgi:hypothetical protein
MNIFEKYSRPEKVARVAEIAAVILAKSIKIEPVEMIDSEHAADGTVYPKADTMHPLKAAAVAELLCKRAQSLHKLAEHDCNYGLSEAQERRAEKLKGEVVEIAKAVGFEVKTGGDPRGAVVVLHDPDDERSGDGWGGGWPVYK